MKNFLLAIFLLSFLTYSCSKVENCDNPLDCLPPITQTGEGTFGCLINGKTFTPGGSQLSGPTKQVSYQFLDGGYHFGMSMDHRKSKTSIFIAVRSQIEEGETYHLVRYGRDSNYGQCYYNGSLYGTNEELNGEIMFTNIDEEKGIVSGSFWFDAVNEEGEMVRIREGRFDMEYY